MSQKQQKKTDEVLAQFYVRYAYALIHILINNNVCVWVDQRTNCED